MKTLYFDLKANYLRCILIIITGFIFVPIGIVNHNSMYIMVILWLVGFGLIFWALRNMISPNKLMLCFDNQFLFVIYEKKKIIEKNRDSIKNGKFQTYKLSKDQITHVWRLKNTSKPSND